MNNQNSSKIDFSKFPVGQQRNIKSEDPRSFWHKMNKKNRIYFAIITVFFIVIIIFLISIFGKKDSSEDIKPTGSNQYAPPAEMEGQNYIPPFP